MYGLEQITLERLNRVLREGAEQTGAVLFPEAKDPDKWAESRQHVALSPLWDAIREMGKEFRNEPVQTVPFSLFMLYGATGDRSAYQRLHFDRRRRLSVFALLYLSEGDPVWKQCLEDTIWTICDEFTWVLPAHVGLDMSDGQERVWREPELPRETVDLFAGETAFALAEIIHLCGDQLHPWISRRVKQEIEKRIFQTCFHQPVPQLWESLDNNWPSVCASCVGAAALYMVNDTERLAGMIWRVLHSLRNYMGSYGEDGATHEGVTYWQYGFSYFVYFAELLRARSGGLIQLLQGERMAQISSFPNALMLANNRLVTFSDAKTSVAYLTGLFRKLHAYFPDVQVPFESQPILKLSGTSSFVEWIRDLLWEIDQNPAEAEGSRENGSSLQTSFFPQVEWFVSKAWIQGELMAFAARGGHNGESHNHNDLGSFILHVGGENVLADLGAGRYTRQYFGKDRYQYLHCGSHGHSVPIIDGGYQVVGGLHKAKVLRHREEEDTAEFCLDLTRAYEVEHLRSFVREFKWFRLPDTQGCQLTLKDSFHYDKTPGSLSEVFITTFPPELIAPGQIVINRTVLLEYDAKQFRYELDCRREPGMLAGDTAVYRILFHAVQSEPQCEYRFRFQLQIIE